MKAAYWVVLHFDGNTIGESQHALKIFGTEGILELGDPNTFNGYVKLIRPEAGSVSSPLHMAIMEIQFFQIPLPGNMLTGTAESGLPKWPGQ